MFQNYNYYPQSNQLTQQQPVYQMPSYRQAPLAPGLKGRLVASIEEARAAAIDFDGSVFYFPDLANKRIYTKQINMDGTATLNMYELRELPNEQMPTAAFPLDKFVTREEFEKVLADLRSPQPKEKIEPLSF